MRTTESLPIVLALLVGAAGGCGNKEREAPRPAKVVSGDSEPAVAHTPAPKQLRADEVAPIGVTIFYLPLPEKDAVKVLRREVERVLPGTRMLSDDTVETAPHPSMHVVSKKPEPGWVPDIEQLSYFARGVTAERIAAVQESEHVLSVAFYADPQDALRVHALAMQAMGAVAEQTGGLLWDDDTRELFTVETWRARSSAPPPAMPDVSTIVTQHAYRDGELLRIVTLGMRKLGYPDVVVNRVPGSLGSDIAALAMLVCQTIVEREGVLDAEGRLTVDFGELRNKDQIADLKLKEGGTGRIAVDLAVAQLEEGDADNRLIEIVFPGPSAKLAERQAAAVVQLFGRDDDIFGASAGDEELEAASKRALETLLGEVKPQWKKKQPELRRLLVKAPFATPDGGSEFMWVEVVRWEGSTIHGLLMNRPAYIPDLHQGAPVEIEEASVFDYKLFLTDGSERGDETTEILQRRERNGR